MAFLLIPAILLAVVWLSYVRRRLSELNENVNTAMNQIGLQLSSRFRALEALLELARTHGLSAQLVLLPPSINALSTPAQVLEQEQHLAQAMSYITVAAESHVCSLAYLVFVLQTPPTSAAWKRPTATAGWSIPAA